MAADIDTLAEALDGTAVLHDWPVFVCPGCQGRDRRYFDRRALDGPTRPRTAQVTGPDRWRCSRCDARGTLDGLRQIVLRDARALDWLRAGWVVAA